MSRWVWVVGALAACGGGSGECDPLTDGAWSGSGAALGMSMGTQLAFDPESCSFTLGSWTMAMDTPTGGTVEGDQVTLDGSAYWQSCTGTATSAGSIEGVCADDGKDFSLTLQ